MTDERNPQPVSREAHADRVARVRAMAADAGNDMRAIDAALSANQRHSVVGPLRTNAFLDRVFPGTTQDDYDAHDAAETQLRETGIRRYHQNSRDAGLDPIPTSEIPDRYWDRINNFGPDKVVDTMHSQRMRQDRALMRVSSLQDEYAEDLENYEGHEDDPGEPHSGLPAHDYFVASEHYDNDDPDYEPPWDTLKEGMNSRRQEMNEALGQVKQVGSQDEWDNSDELPWLEPGPLANAVSNWEGVIPRSQVLTGYSPSQTPADVAEALVSNKYVFATEMSPLFQSNRSNLEAMRYQKQVLGHSRAATEHGQIASPIDVQAMPRAGMNQDRQGNYHEVADYMNYTDRDAEAERQLKGNLPPDK